MSLISQRIKQDRVWWVKIRGITCFTYKYCTRPNLVIIYAIIYYFFYQCLLWTLFSQLVDFIDLLSSFHYKRLRLKEENKRCFSQGQSGFTHLIKGKSLSWWLASRHVRSFGHQVKERKNTCNFEKVFVVLIYNPCLFFVSFWLSNLNKIQ